MGKVDNSVALADDLRRFACKVCPVCELAPDILQAVHACIREVPRPAIRQWLKERHQKVITAWELRKHIEENHGKDSH